MHVLERETFKCFSFVYLFPHLLSLFITVLDTLKIVEAVNISDFASTFVAVNINTYKIH